MKHYFQNNKNDDDYVYDIDFEKYVDKIVNSDDEINVIITEKEFYDKANSLGQEEVTKFAKELIKKQSNP